MDTTQKHLPFDPEALVPFSKELFDREEVNAARILFSILETQSPPKSDWSQVFSESSEGANYRTIDRALTKLDAKDGAHAPLRSPEPVRVGRPYRNRAQEQAKSTEYVGRLSDGKTLGFWMIVFAQPYRGRAIPFHFGGPTPQATIAEEATRAATFRGALWCGR